MSTGRHPLRSLLAVLAVRNVATWPNFMIFVVLTCVGNWVASGVAYPSWLVALLVPVAAAAAAWLPILALKAAALRRGGLWCSPWMLLAAFVTAGAVRGAALDGLLLALGLTGETRIGYRIISGILVCVVALEALAYVTQEVRFQAHAVAQLQHRTVELSNARDRARASLAESSGESIERIRGLLTAEVSRMDADLPEESLATLQRTASDIVRPLSHDLASQVPRWSPGSAFKASTARIDLRTVFGGRAASRPFRPAATAIVISLFAAPMSLAGLPLPAAVVLPLLTGLVCWLLLKLLNIAMGVAARYGPRASVPTAIGGLIICALAEGAILRVILPGIGGPIGLALAVGATAYFAALAAIFGTFTAAAGERALVQEQLEASAEEMRWQLARVGQVQWYQQRALSRALHGPIQSAITSAAIRLDAALREGRDTRNLVAETQHQLARIIDDLETSVDDATHMGSGGIVLHSALERLRAVWDGIAVIDVLLAPAAARLLAEDPIAAVCIAELIGESTSNAIRHGGARSISISLAPDSTTVTLTIEDDGVQVTSSRSGLGTRMLDEMALASSTTWLPDGRRRLTMVVPVSSGGASLTAA